MHRGFNVTVVLTLLSFLTAERIRERGVFTVGFWHGLVSSVATFMPTQLPQNLKSIGFPAISGLCFHLPLVVNQGSHSDWKKWAGIFQSGNFEQGQECIPVGCVPAAS